MNTRIACPDTENYSTVNYSMKKTRDCRAGPLGGDGARKGTTWVPRLNFARLAAEGRSYFIPWEWRALESRAMAQGVSTIAVNTAPTRMLCSIGLLLRQRLVGSLRGPLWTHQDSASWQPRAYPTLR